MVTWLHIEYVFWNRMAVYCAQYARYALQCVSSVLYARYALQCAFKLHCFEPPMRLCGKTINSLFINSVKSRKWILPPNFSALSMDFEIASYNTVFNATQFMCFVNGKRVFDVNVQLPEARVKNVARLEREDLWMGIDIWKCKNISRICSIFQTMWVQF